MTCAVRLAVSMGVAACAAILQAGMAPGLVRGHLLEWDGAKAAGEFSIRTASHQVYRFRFDAKTYVERDGEMCAIGKLLKGDLLEVVSDGSSPTALSYARTVHVVGRPASVRRPPSLGRYRAYREGWQPILPAGNLTVSGVVARIERGRLVLRTRREGEKAVLLRDDTRYVAEGTEVPAATLKTGTVVFVRGSRNFEDQMEADKVIWGRILQP